MARVRSLQRNTLQSERVHDEVECTYSVFTVEDGTRLFQIDTYGSPGREFPGKKSQTIQFDAETARSLVDILRTEFRF